MDTNCWARMKSQETPPNNGELLWATDGKGVCKATWTWDGLPDVLTDDASWITAGEWRDEHGWLLNGITHWCCLHESPDGPPEPFVDPPFPPRSLPQVNAGGVS